jgi:ubiquinone/menaquinone biosynthesis C-methylase UbiE
MRATACVHGDFTTLAEKYSAYRPDYSVSVMNAIFGIINKPRSALDVADVGAGTGIWTRMLAASGCRSVVAVEPNDEMRKMGGQHIHNGKISWLKGSGEETTLADESCDLISMASSFHWVDFEKGTAEFNRVLKPNGYFVALWNPRYINDDPLLVDIENKIYELSPNVKRVSSGKSAFVDDLSKKLEENSLFSEVIYLQGKHKITMSAGQYIGAWESVNDVRVQMGEENFEKFMNYVKSKILPLGEISCTYLTRAWAAKKR